MSMLNLDELNSKINSKNKVKIEIYEKILKNCHNRIKHSAETNNTGFCFYTIPRYVYGIPLYNYTECTNYIIDMLSKNGFDLKYTHPNLLYISWAGKTNPKSYKINEKKNTGIKPIENYNVNQSILYNKNVLENLENKIKFLKNS